MSLLSKYRFIVSPRRFGASLVMFGMATAICLSPTANAADTALPVQKVDASLHAKLPPDILAAKTLVSVNQGSYPPYDIVTGPNTLDGVSGDLATALGQLLGVNVVHQEVNGLSGVLAGLKSGRYAFALGPVGDFPDREKSNDFIDFVQEFDVFAVPVGNPKKIDSLADSCGNRIAVIAGGAAEKVVQQYSTECGKAGKSPVTVMSFAEQPTAILAVRSGRADAVFSAQAPLTYFVDQSHGALALAAVGKANGFHDLYQGAVVAKGSPLGPILVDAFQKLIDNGSYAAILAKWHIQRNAVAKATMNLPGQLALNAAKKVQ